MNRAELKNILQEHYDRVRWNKTLHFLSGNRNLLQLSLEPKLIEINTTEADRIVKTFYQVGTLKTSDGVTLPVFEIILEDNIRIEYNKAGVNDFIKKYIIKDAVKGALATFAYETDERKEWRFSFISKNSASDFFAEAEAEETNPKKYTYIFGTQDEHRTAIERLYNLEQSRFRLEDFFEAFNVEPVSKKFFDEYKKLYQDFSDYLLDENRGYISIFENQKDPEHKTEKEARNFVSRLMGRIVFLYFLQKKHWLGASNTEYKDGNPHFISDLFFNDVANQNDFYEKYLCPIFFNALNTPDRKNDEFKLENGQTVSIPFLNGGLFEEEQEPNGHRNIQFRKDLFESLFNFFNGYNFTIYENSPEEHTVAVDPEMLGHIFENLIDYNKDTGTFYTPKEIVQYMTQESLIEYLNTHLENERKEIENLVKNQSRPSFSDKELEKIENLLDAVKICDPAVGSGAFPMGMLQEIFNLKALIAYELKKEWNPAEVKQEIIQSSIYGVDLDEGAVEIARLRFWLSLVVDEGKPKPLPNLSYKILVGNSIVDKFEQLAIEIDWSLDSTKKGLFAQDIIEEKISLLKEISTKQKEYFFSTGKTKHEIHQQISDLKLEILSKELQIMITSKGTEYKSLTRNSKKQNELFEQTLRWKAVLEKINILKNNKESDFFHFDWCLDFPEVLNPILVDESKRGFDIVIGNPPYIEFKNLDKKIKAEIENKEIGKYVTLKGKYDIYIAFYELAYRLIKKNALLTYITPTRFLNRDYGRELRNFLRQNMKFIEITDFGDKQNFESAITYTGIFRLKKTEEKEYVFSVQNSLDSSKKLKFDNEYLNGNSWYFNDEKVSDILDLIRKDTIPLKTLLDGIFQGVATGKDNVFILNKSFVEEHKIETDYLVKFLKGKDISPYKIEWKDNYCIYPYDDDGKVISETDLSKNSPNLYEYLVESKNLLKGRGYFDKSNKLWFELWNQRNKKKFQTCKIITLDNASRNSFAFDDKGFMGTTTTYSLVPIINNTKIIQVLLAILNSKVLDYYHKKNTIPQAGGFYRYQASFIESLPIIIGLEKYKYIGYMAEIITALKSYLNNIKIGENYNNNQISDFFQDVIDGCVFDIYFDQETTSNNIRITDAVNASIEKYNIHGNFNDLDEIQKKNIIVKLYEEWSTGIVQIKMADYITKSPDILKPILQS